MVNDITLENVLDKNLKPLKSKDKSTSIEISEKDKEARLSKEVPQWYDILCMLSHPISHIDRDEGKEKEGITLEEATFAVNYISEHGIEAFEKWLYETQ